MIFVFRNFKFAIVPYGKTIKPQLSGKREVVERNGVKFETVLEVEYIWGIFNLVVFKVIFGSFDTLATFPKYDFQKTTSTNRTHNLSNFS